MKGLALILSLCIIAESVLISFPFTLVFIILISIFREENIDIFVFVAGFFLDFMALRILGIDSLFFLTLLYIGGRYRKKIYEGAFIYKLLFLMITFVIYNWLFYKSFNLYSILVTTVLGSILLVWFEKIFPENDKKRLAV